MLLVKGRSPEASFLVLICSLILLLALIIMPACDPLEEKSGDAFNIPNGGDWSFPYSLVIGGGLSETLDLATIQGPGELDLRHDVRRTGSGISQTVIYDDELYALCSLSHSVIVYDLVDLEIKREIGLGLGNNPIALAFGPEKNAFITNYITNTVTVYRLGPDIPEADRLLTTIPMPDQNQLPHDSGSVGWARPSGIVYIDGRVFVALSNLGDVHTAAGDGLVAVIDAQDYSIEALIQLSGRDTLALWHDQHGERLFVVSAGSYKSGEGFVGDGLVEIVDLVGLQIVDSLEVDGSPFEIAVCPNRMAFLGNGKEAVVLGFDLDTLEPIDPVTLDSGGGPAELSFASALACDGNNLLYVTDFNSDQLFVIDTEDQNKILLRTGTTDGPDTMTLIP